MKDEEALWYVLGILTMCFINWLGRMGRKMIQEDKEYANKYLNKERV